MWNVRAEADLEDPVLLAAFGGWADASNAATGAVRHLIEVLPTRLVAVLDPDDYYDFTVLRPVAVITGPTDRALQWPEGSIHASRREGRPHLLLFTAPEPHMRWRAFMRHLFDLAERWHVRRAMVFGAAVAAISHRGPVIVSGWSPDPQLKADLAAAGVPFSPYQGPASASSAFVEAATARGIPAASMFAYTPNYLSVPFNPKVAFGMLDMANRVLDLRVDLARLQALAAEFEQQVDEAVAQNPDAQALMARVEEGTAPGPVPGVEQGAPPPQEPSTLDASEIVAELEAFLRRPRDVNGSEESDNSDEEESRG